ncbi:MAG: hypothetical protein ACPG70_08295, partial [Candidatus Puniceispirillaceae bacterium]
AACRLIGGHILAAQIGKFDLAAQGNFFGQFFAFLKLHFELDDQVIFIKLCLVIDRDIHPSPSQ